MPLLKRKQFNLVEPPPDLNPDELVYQIRFTQEIFRDYKEYLRRLNLYRQRVWTCKVTGKANLTYEEALVSEHRACEKAQQFPKELRGPVLRMIQYSSLNLNDLVNMVYRKLHEDLFEGLELHGKKDDSVVPCKILKVLDNDGTTRCEVAWVGKGKAVSGTAVLNIKDIVRKKPPLSRNTLKVFIRESTSQSAPWVLHENVARKHGIPMEPPKDMKDKLTYQNGFVRFIKAPKQECQEENYDSTQRGTSRKRAGDTDSNSMKKRPKNGDLVRYPIDDLLLQPDDDDPHCPKRPPCSTDFRVPVHCVGDLLMVWDFCSSFGRQLNLWPFSLTDFENAICHKDSNLVLIVEIHAAMFYLIKKDNGKDFTAARSKRWKKVTQVNWTDYLCDFLEALDDPDLSTHVATIKRGHYGLLDTGVKLGIIHKLVDLVLTTATFRDDLDECINQKQALSATKRVETKRKKEELELKIDDLDKSDVRPNHVIENGHGSLVQSGKLEISINSNDLKGQHKGKVKDRNLENMEDKHLDWVEREIEKLTIRASPLGKDRYHNRYWFFRREGRLFVEQDAEQWGYYSSKDELDALISSLNQKGIRERALRRQLEKLHPKISLALEKRSKDAQRILLNEAVLRRSTRVRAQPRENPVMAFLKYVNKWREN